MGFRKVCTVLVCVAGMAAAQDNSERFYRAVRDNDLKTLRALVKTGDTNVRDKRGSTPLMYAAAAGSLDTMRILLAAGADVNARNAFDATALMWGIGDADKVRVLIEKGADVNARSRSGRTPLLLAASQAGASATVQLLISKGADPAARDNFQRTALHAATQANDLEMVTLLVRKGADVNARSATGNTPLMNAAEEGNYEMVTLLLERGADVNAVSEKQSGPVVKNGPLALGLFTPLILASPYGEPQTVKALLDHGAKVNAQDVRGMTPLMLAVASDRADARVVRLLLERGADPGIRSATGETAGDWARKYHSPAVMHALGIEDGEREPTAVEAAGAKRPDLKGALGRSIGLLQRVHADFMNEGGCVACHAQNLTALALRAAKGAGVAMDEAMAAEQLKIVKLHWSSLEQPLLQHEGPGGGPDTVVYAMFHLATEGAPADRMTDAMVHYLAAEQRGGGNWRLGGISRAPMEDGDFSRTSMAIRCLRLYGAAGRRTEFDQRVARAVAWLRAATPLTTEDRTMQLLGLKWSGADRDSLQALLSALIAQQREDGGWAQSPDLASDAYATGEALYTLHELGAAATSPAYRRGVDYLLRTQREDGSWHVRSRAPKFQPYFQSGFPHDHDQWISAAGTAWAATALAYAAEGPPVERAGRRFTYSKKIHEASGSAVSGRRVRPAGA